MLPLSTLSGISLDVASQHEADNATRSDPSHLAPTWNGRGKSAEYGWPAGHPILWVGALISLVAASIHVLVTPEHFQEWWGYGVFFLVSAVLQAVFALVVIGRPSRAVLIAGLVGNLAIVAMWVVSRSSGVPFFGPNVGEIEEIGVHDIVATAAEIVLVLLLAYALVARNRSGTTMIADA